jgi:hypothetical protein
MNSSGWLTGKEAKSNSEISWTKVRTN